MLILSFTLDENKEPLPTPIFGKKKHNGALGGDSGDTVGGGLPWLVIG